LLLFVSYLYFGLGERQDLQKEKTMFAAAVKPETRFVSLVAVMGGGVF
jgi:hypothetical protein